MHIFGGAGRELKDALPFLFLRDFLMSHSFPSLAPSSAECFDFVRRRGGAD